MNEGRRTEAVYIRVIDAISASTIADGQTVTEDAGELIDKVCVGHGTEGMGEGKGRDGGVFKGWGKAMDERSGGRAQAKRPWSACSLHDIDEKPGRCGGRLEKHG